MSDVVWWGPPLEGPHPFRLEWRADASQPSRSLLSVSKEGVVYVGPQLSAGEMQKLSSGPLNFTQDLDVSNVIEISLRSILVLSSEIAKLRKELNGCREEIQGLRDTKAKGGPL